MSYTCFIYALKCPNNKEIKYIGATSNVDRRYSQHLKYKKNCEKSKWISSLLSENKRPFIEIIEECEYEEAKKREAFHIEKALLDGAVLYNKKAGGAIKKSISIGDKKTQVVLKGYTYADIELLGGYDSVKEHAESSIDRKLKQTKK